MRGEISDNGEQERSMKGDGPKALLQSCQACVRSDRDNSVVGVQAGAGM